MQRGVHLGIYHPGSMVGMVHLGIYHPGSMVGCVHPRYVPGVAWWVVYTLGMYHPGSMVGIHLPGYVPPYIPWVYPYIHPLYVTRCYRVVHDVRVAARGPWAQRGGNPWVREPLSLPDPKSVNSW